jgi:hypothetical protein
MRGHELIAGLSRDFIETGTAGLPVFMRDLTTGKVFQIVGTEREVHEDADGAITHWITVEEV